jgi:endonuclease YncB( thermonuclease family)
VNQPAMTPRRRRRLARLMRVVNVPMRRLLRLPFQTPLSRRLMLLSFTGRKTGREYRQPVSYVPDGDTLLTPGGGRWKLNLREGEPIRVRLRGRDVLARPESIRDVDEIEQLLRRMTASNPRVASFIPVIGRDGQIDRDGLQAAVDYGFSIIRWHIDQAPSRGRS